MSAHMHTFMCVVQGLQLTGFRTCTVINLYISNIAFAIESWSSRR